MSQHQNKFRVFSLDPYQIGDWVFKISMNDEDDSILVLGYHPIFQYSILRRFDIATEAREWVNSLVKSSIIIEREGLDDE